MLDLDARRLDRARRRAENQATERGEPLDALPTAEALLAEAEARDGYDRFALAGIGRVVPFTGHRNW